MSKEQVQANIAKIVQFLKESSYYRHRTKLIAALSSIDVQTASSSSTDITDEELTRELLESNMRYIPYKLRNEIILDCMNHLSSAMTTVNASHPSIIWSWVLQVSTMQVPVKRTFNIGRLNDLPFDLLRIIILSYLSRPEQQTLLTRKRHTSHTIFKLPHHAALNEIHLLEEFSYPFSYLVSREGEDNENKAEKILKRYPHLAEKLISDQHDMRDPNRHFIKPMSAYEYAYWSGDARMRRMMERYMDEKTKTIVYEQCKHIAEQGVSYELLSNGKIVPDSIVSNSKHFDFQPLMAAYNTYIAEVERVFTIRNRDDSVVWTTADTLWLNIGKKLAEVPVHVAQEYCSELRPLNDYTPYTSIQNTFTDSDFKRTVKFDNWTSGARVVESWFSQGLPNADLGRSFSIAKSGYLRAQARRKPFRIELSGPDRYNNGWCAHYSAKIASSDLRACAELCKGRMDYGLKKTLKDLEPAEPGSQLNL